MSQWQNQLNALKAEIETKSKQLALIEQLIALEAKHADDHDNDFNGHPVFGAVIDNSEDEGEEHNNKPAKRKAATRTKAHREFSESNGEKKMRLPSLLVVLGQQNAGRALTYKELAEMVQASGYASESKNFSNMVYQSLQKLVKRGVYNKNEETREYHFVGK